MNYRDARPKIRSGDLLAWTHRGWGSIYDIELQIVRMFTRSEYCHVAMAWRLAGRVFVLEAVGTGVRIFPLSRLLPCYWLHVNMTWGPVPEEFACNELGEPYSKWQSILAGLGLLKAGSDSTWQCAEFVQSIYRAGGMEWCAGIDPTPANIVREAQGAGAPVYWIAENAKS